MPSIDPILITLDGFSLSAELTSKGNKFCVKKNIDLTHKSITLSHPISGKLSIGAAQAAPALFTKISK